MESKIPRQRLVLFIHIEPTIVGSFQDMDDDDSLVKGTYVLSVLYNKLKNDMKYYMYVHVYCCSDSKQIGF